MTGSLLHRPHQLSYFAHQLTLRAASDSMAQLDTIAITQMRSPIGIGTLKQLSDTGEAKGASHNSFTDGSDIEVTKA